MITPLAVFEELRFVWELLAANLLFLLPFARKRKHFLLHLTCGIPLLSLLVMLRFLLISQAGVFSGDVYRFLFSALYIFLALCVMGLSLCCFRLTISDALYFTVSGYAAQHLVYVLIHEVVGRLLFPALPAHMLFYIPVTLVGCVALYWPLYAIFAPRLKQCGGQMLSNEPQQILYYLIMLVILMICTFSCQHLFEIVPEQQYLGATLGALICMLILAAMYGALVAVRAGQDRAISEQMIRDAEQHYHHSRELIEYVSRTIHDLKHTLKAFEQATPDERENFSSQTKALIEDYQQLIYSDNEVLNTILSEKALLCKKKGISFSVTMEQVDLSFLSVPDLYVILGNAIDNAMEGTEKVTDPQKRAISISIQSKGGFAVIQTNNYFSGMLRMEGALPMTSKTDRLGHGYGLKSIRALAEKYGGSISVANQEQVFILIVLIPLP